MYSQLCLNWLRITALKYLVVGLYSSIFPGLMYAIFGSCKDVTVGPTAILAALLAKYVAKSEDFAYLASFLTGLVIFLLGVLQLGFLLDFISKPVISGFTTAAALQISAAQLKSLFRVAGSSGNTFISALINFFKNIGTVQLWDTILGVATIISLFLIKRSTITAPEGSSKCRSLTSATWLYVVRARNALVVFVGSILAYVLFLYGKTPFKLTGTIHGGLPRFGLPPFSTTVNNVTLGFDGMLAELGPEGLVMPLVAILESIAIAKAFAGSRAVDATQEMQALGLCNAFASLAQSMPATAGSRAVDATQEMLALGLCNAFASLAQSMPATGSFTRTALNHASGVVTPAGSFFKACLVLLSVTLLAEAFYFIPRATLAGIIMVAMISIIELSIVKRLWQNSKAELCVWLLTVVLGACVGLEYGIAGGVAADALRALFTAARPHLHTECVKLGNQDCIIITFTGTLSYASAEHVAHTVRSQVQIRSLVFVFDGRQLRACDFGVAENLTTVILDLEKNKHSVLLWNFDVKIRKLFEDISQDMSHKFVSGPSLEDLVLGLQSARQDSSISIPT
ncbi:unnamed protein product [Colias eurytheme]|nr:unnamed protein product [Colias eurytheme]